MTNTTHPISGRDAARRLWRRGLSDVEIDDPLTDEFARAALDELEVLQKDTPGVLREVLQGAQMSAEQLNVEPFHGVIEVIQNADDLGAREVRIAIRDGGHRSSLLIAHNGNRVRLEHVLAMTLAFVSTKRDDPRSKGRFGIGLKTLGRLGDSLTVNCPPYGFVIEGNSVRPQYRSRGISGFYDARSTDTLFALRLHPSWNTDDLRSWFASLGASSMVFLDSVKSLRLVDVRRKKTIAHHKLTRSHSETITLPGMKESCDRVLLKEPRTRHAWVKYVFHRKVPSNLHRRYKAMGETTPVGIAIPDNVEDRGRIYAGLPLGITTRLPYSLNAQFDVDTARRGIQHNALNKWLFDRVTELTTAVALERLRTAPASAWKTIPLSTEQHVDGDAWVADGITRLVESVQRRIRRVCSIVINGECQSLADVTYEDKAIEGVVDERDAEVLKSQLVMLTANERDPESRWRAVLDDLGHVERLEVRDALKLLDLDDEQLSRRDVGWFIRLARAGIEGGLGKTLWNLKSVITRDERRIVPPMPHVEGELLIHSSPPSCLATRLDLAHVIHSDYLADQSDATVVRQWLEGHGMLRDAPDAYGSLRALATHGKRRQPIELNDECLCLVRDALEKVGSSSVKQLGLDVGRAIALDVQLWEDGKRVSDTARPADAYLPARIEDRKDGWSKAAAQTPRIKWIHGRYREVLKQTGVDSKERRLGARAVLRLLGAEDTPRMMEPGYVETRHDDPASPIGVGQLSNSQRTALAQLGRHATHLKRERMCPDLYLVLKGIRAEPNRRVRRDRSTALLRTLDREWNRVYAGNLETPAVYSYRTWHRAGVIPTNWIAQLMDEPWLTNEAGEPRCPPEVVVRTPATEAIFGDNRDLFAFEIDATLAQTQLIRALGVRSDPQVSEMVDELRQIREGGKDVDSGRIRLLYAAISAACKKRDPQPSDGVGDLTVRELRSRFGTSRSKQGLVFAADRWLSPSSVLLGASIFGDRQAFVSEKSAVALWKTLGIVRADLDDCIDVLMELADSPAGPAEQEILVNTYQYMESILTDATAKQANRLASLPLWTGEKWVTRRPVYVAYESGIARALANSLPVWDIPVSAKAVPGLIESVDATLLNEECFDPLFHQQSFSDGMAYQARFRATVKLLQDWLARHDRKLSKAHSLSWQELAEARISIEPLLRLECRIGRRAPITVDARVHVTHRPLTFYFADPEAIGEDDAGGLVLSSFFTDGDREKLALAWSRCWQRAAKGETGRISLAEDAGDDTPLSELFKQAKKDPRLKRRLAAGAKPKGRKAIPEKRQTEFPVRQLKALDDLTEKTVRLTSSDDVATPQISRRRGLQKDIPAGRPVGGRDSRAPRTAPLAYSEQEKEELALLVLRQAINGDFTELRDYHHLRGVGADAIDKLRRFFELKASYGALPDEISLTANEVERAVREGKNYFLAVVAGLEEGYDTVVKIVSNPLQNLRVKQNTSVTLAGIHTVRSAIEVRFTEDSQ